MERLEMINSLSSPEEAQTLGSELDDGAVYQLFETLLDQESQQPAARSTDVSAALGEKSLTCQKPSQLPWLLQLWIR
jgi:hypothetical protein